jgi:predicted nucleotidyltransferase
MTHPIQYDEALLAETASNLGVELVIAFGSRVSGDPPPVDSSDLDLAVLDTQSFSGTRFLAVHGGLATVFSAYEIDLSFLKRADPYFRSEIFRTGRCLYGDIQLFFEQEAYAFKSYADSSDLRLLERVLFEKQLARIDEALAR